MLVMLIGLITISRRSQKEVVRGYFHSRNNALRSINSPLLNWCSTQLKASIVSGLAVAGSRNDKFCLSYSKNKSSDLTLHATEYKTFISSENLPWNLYSWIEIRQINLSYIILSKGDSGSSIKQFLIVQIARFQCSPQWQNNA